MRQRLGFLFVSLFVGISDYPLFGGACVEPENGKLLAAKCVHCVVSLQVRYKCEFSGDALTQTDDSDESSIRHCICTRPQCWTKSGFCVAKYDVKWWCCNCTKSYVIECHEEEEIAAKTEIVATDDSDETLTSVSADLNSSPRNPAPATSFGTTSILLILLLLVAVAFIVVIVIFIIRKRKYDRRYDASSTNNTDRNEPVSSQSVTVAPVIRPSDGTIPSDNNVYVDVEMTKRPPPFDSTTYASVQPTSKAVDMGKSVDYVDIDFPKKDQQKARNVNETTAYLSPIYTEPFEPPTSDSNTEYAEPFKPDQRPTANAPVLSHNAAGYQQNIYSLAKAIPLGNPNVIYSEPNKPAKSATPTATGGAVNTTDCTYLEAIEVKHGAGSGLDATQDPSAVYAEPIKLKKSA